jgi:hypothetical protein
MSYLVLVIYVIFGPLIGWGLSLGYTGLQHLLVVENHMPGILRFSLFFAYLLGTFPAFVSGVYVGTKIKREKVFYLRNYLLLASLSTAINVLFFPRISCLVTFSCGNLAMKNQLFGLFNITLIGTLTAFILYYLVAKRFVTVSRSKDGI